MTPRSYRPGKRAAAAAETRRRIVEATVALHSEKGVAATSWQDIAERADVAVGTVYFHFPSYDELIPACTGMGFAMYPPPAPEMFRGVRSRKKRVEMLVAATFESYRPMRGALVHVPTERHTIPAVGRVADEMDAQARALVRAAIGDDVAEATAKAVEALIDFRVWDSLRERGLDDALINGTVTTSILSLLARAK